MGFFDGLLDTLTLGGYSAVSDLLGTPMELWRESRAKNNAKDLLRAQTDASKQLQSHQAQLGKDVFDYTFGKEASLNSQLMHDSPSIQKDAMASAGINPASQFGTFSGNLAQSSAPAYSGSVSSPSVSPSRGNPSDILNLMLQKPLIDANKSLTEANKTLVDTENAVKQQELRRKTMENDEKENEQTVYKYLTPTVEIKSLEGDGETISIGISGKLGFEAYKNVKALQRDLHQIELDDLDTRFNYLVRNKQIKDDEVIYALQRMPFTERVRILSEIAEFASRVALNSQLVNESGERINLMTSQRTLNNALEDLYNYQNGDKRMKKLFNTSDRMAIGLDLGFKLIPQIIQAAASFAK